ncbi:conserved domain-containing protein [Blastococcus aurantiacus]|uniref:Conserved domain-containing protein n=1 Tax=Blastococcus aurantiacus TaxID=1550231 RepID=A0A1G7QFW5_9ACTN|nr:YsnF/AvaK domain-containing protein [Blastococcus aurantiacus]SDF97447.1 conserved domain-containing protein [Blastococcus aurantiacus]
MVSERDVSAAIGSTAYGSDGESVGTVETFYTDDVTGATTWVSVSSGLLGRKQAIAPADDATFVDGRLQLSVPADSVSQAPRMSGEHLAPEDEEALRRHYARGAAAGGDDVERRAVVDDSERRPVVDGAATQASGTPAHAAPVHDVAGGGDGSMVRSEEQLRVGTEQVAAKRMRVVKYVVTEEVQITVPVRREEIRIEEVPMDALDTDGGVVTEGEPLQAGYATDELAGGTRAGGSLTDGLPDEIVLHTERPVVTVEVVPVERVRLTTEVVAGQTSVSETVRREQVTVDQHAVPRGS